MTTNHARLELWLTILGGVGFAFMLLSGGHVPTLAFGGALLAPLVIYLTFSGLRRDFFDD